MRQLHLLQALERRGHAALQRLQLHTHQAQQWRNGTLPKPLHKARAHPQWATLNSGTQVSAADRQAQVLELAGELADAMREARPEQT